MTKLTHLEHVEDHIMNDGLAGYQRSIDTLDAIDDMLRGININNVKISVKYDGSPSIIFGYNKSGLFFVATKSIFNKTPKLNYTNNDIEENHGHSRDLTLKLKQALEHLPKITRGFGIYQGDIMFTKSDISIKNGQVRFTPNTITYAIAEESYHGQKILKAKIGIAVHTKYEGDYIETMQATLCSDFEYSPHSDVFVIDTSHKMSGIRYSAHDSTTVATVLTCAVKCMDNISTPAIKQHGPILKTYINSTVKNKQHTNVGDFIKYCEKHFDKKINSVKKEQNKEVYIRNKEVNMTDIHNNKLSFHHLFAMIDFMQQAKKIILNYLSKIQKFDHYIDDIETKPEGYVVVVYGKVSKLVDRKEFSAANFNKLRA